MNLIDEILKHQHKVEMRANELGRAMFKELMAVRSKVVGMLMDLEDDILKRDFVDETLERRKRFLEYQRAEIEKVLAQVYDDACAPLIIEATSDVIKATSIATTGAMNAVLRVSKPFYKLDKKYVEAWFESATVEGLVLNEWLAKIEQAAVDRILKVQRQSMIEGLSVKKMASIMRKRGFEGSRPGVANLARTLLHSASHHARDKVITERFRDDIKGWQYVATLDGRTCLVCGGDDGKFFKVGDPKPSLPQHWSCRCCYAPVPKDMPGLPDIEETRPAVKHSARTVHHRDGSTSTKFTVAQVEQSTESYNQWLRRQLREDPGFVRSILGKGRFELFKRGKLSLNRMVTNGRLKNLSELKA